MYCSNHSHFGQVKFDFEVETVYETHTLNAACSEINGKAMHDILQFTSPHLTQDPRLAVMATIGSLRLVPQQHYLKQKTDYLIAQYSNIESRRSGFLKIRAFIWFCPFFGRKRQRYPMVYLVCIIGFPVI